MREYDENEELATRKVQLDVGPYKNVETLAVGDEGTTVEVKVQRLFEEGEPVPDVGGETVGKH